VGRRPAPATRQGGQKALALIDQIRPQGRFFLFIHFGDARRQRPQVRRGFPDTTTPWFPSTRGWPHSGRAQADCSLRSHRPSMSPPTTASDVGNTHTKCNPHLPGQQRSLLCQRASKRLAAHRHASSGRGPQQNHPGLPGKSLRKQNSRLRAPYPASAPAPAPVPPLSNPIAQELLDGICLSLRASKKCST